MDDDLAVLRLGHRPGRDDRMTTHVALTARALGADRVILPANARDAADTATDVTNRFGGPFAVERVETPLSVVREWDGAVVHLTMYGERVQDVTPEIRAGWSGSDDEEDDESGDESDDGREGGDPVLVVVGAEKVPFEVYERADWNVGVTSQPHSEVAALAVFLDRLFDGRELDREWADADRRVVPTEAGKRVEDTSGGDASGEGAGPA